MLDQDVSFFYINTKKNNEWDDENLWSKQLDFRSGRPPVSQTYNPSWRCRFNSQFQVCRKSLSRLVLKTGRRLSRNTETDTLSRFLKKTCFLFLQIREKWRNEPKKFIKKCINIRKRDTVHRKKTRKDLKEKQKRRNLT